MRRPLTSTLIASTLLALATTSAVLAPLTAADAAPGSSGAPTAPTGTVTTNTSWLMRGDEGDYILGGQTRRYGVDDGITATTDGTAGVHLSVPGAPWDLRLNPADGDVLEAGRTYIDTADFTDSTVPSLDLFGEGRGCSTVTGRFTINEIAFQGQTPTAFSATFEQHCGGKPATYGSVAWNATAPAAPVQPLVSIRTDKKHTGYGKKLAVTARVSNDSPIRTLSVFATPYGGRKQLIVRDQVDSDGVLRFTTRLARRTTLAVELEGGDQFQDKRDATTVTVAAAVASKQFGTFHRVGKYAVYGPRHAAILASAVSPNHRGDCLRFRLQFKVSGSWGYDSVVRCSRLNRKSVAAVKLAYDRRLVGIPFRLRSEWTGDKANTAVNGGWKLGRFAGSSRVVARPLTDFGSWRPELVAR